MSGEGFTVVVSKSNVLLPYVVETRSPDGSRRVGFTYTRIGAYWLGWKNLRRLIKSPTTTPSPTKGESQ